MLDEVARFADVSAAANLDLIDDSRGVAAVDWDHDGDLDLWITTRNAPGIRFLRNEVTAHNEFVAIRLEGNRCNRDGVGARVQIQLHGVSEQLVQTVRAGDAFVSQSSKWLHFGLGSTAEIDCVTVRWPGTQMPEEFSGVSAGSRFLLVQDAGVADRMNHNANRATSLRPMRIKLPEPTDAARVVLTRRRKLPQISYFDFAGQPTSLSENAGPLLLNLWASWCAPCLDELRDLKENAAQIRDHGLNIIALSMDGVGDGDVSVEVRDAIEIIRKLNPPFRTGLAGETLLKQLHVLNAQVFYRERPLPVPSSFLIDEDGRVAIMYRGTVSSAQLRADIDLIEKREPSRIESEVFPLGGRSGIGLLPIDALGFARAYYEGEYYDDAREQITRFTRQRHASGTRRPASDKDHLRLAEAFHLLGRTEEASQDTAAAAVAYRRALEFAPNATGTRVSLATVLWEKGEPDEADAQLQTVEDSGSDLIRTQSLLARARMRFGQPDRAVTHLKKALGVQPDNTLLGLELAVALKSSRQVVASIEKYKQLLNRNPGLLPAANNLAWIYATDPHKTYRNADEAVRLASFVCRATQYREPAYLDTLAAAYAEAGKFLDATRVAEQAIALFKQTRQKANIEPVRRRAKAYQQQRPFRDHPDRPGERTQP